jgi:prepilin-type processing-associated H-X9-DG protein
MYVGFDNDNARSTNGGYYPPRRDHPQLQSYQIFGSAHPGGLNISLCDGSVRPMSYTIDQTVFLNLGNRSGGVPVSLE